MNVEDWKAVASLGGIAALAAACRTIMSEDERTLVGFLSRFVLGVFAGMMVGFALEGSGLSDGVQYAIVSGSALAAKETLTAVIKVAETVRDQSATVTKNIIKKKTTRGKQDGQS